MATTVNLGSVTITDYGSKVDVSNGNGITDYEVRSKYYKFESKYVMSITSPNNYKGMGCAFVQLAKPTLLWVCKWTALRLGAKPAVPSPIPKDKNWILLDSCPETVSLNVTPSGDVPMYRMSGVYVYGHRNPSTNIFNDVAFPIPPFLDDTSFTRTITNSDLDSSIADDSGVTGFTALNGQNLDGFITR